jgi:hypothetical protein
MRTCSHNLRESACQLSNTQVVARMGRPGTLRGRQGCML